MSDPDLAQDDNVVPADNETVAVGAVAPFSPMNASGGSSEGRSQNAENVRLVDGKLPLSQLHVSIDVCLPSQKISLSEVTNWMKGGLVPLPAMPLESGIPIEIRHGTQVMATGSLVLLDDCYAVQIDKVMVKGG